MASSPRSCLLRCPLVTAFPLVGAVWVTCSAWARTLPPSAAAIARAANDPRVDLMLRQMLVKGAPDPLLMRETGSAVGSMSDKIPLLLRGNIQGAHLSRLGVQIG